MKAVLKDGTELLINSYANLTENRFQVSFARITSYDELRAKLVVATLQTIKVYTDETSFTAYENYTKVIDPSTITTASDGTLDVVIIFEREDEVIRKINELSTRQVLVEDALNEIILK